MLTRRMRMFMAAATIVACSACGICSAADGRPGSARETVIFEEDFESGKLDAWEVRGGKIEIITEGGSRVCRIVSQKVTSRTTLQINLPVEKLHDKRLYLHCRYRLTDYTRDPDSQYGGTVFQIYHTGPGGRGRSWRGAPMFPATDAKPWRTCRAPSDMFVKVGEAQLRIGFGNARGTLLIDDIRLTVEPKSLPPRSDEVIADNSGDGFSKTGRWNVSAKVPGYCGSNYLWSPKGDGSSAATWTLTAPTDGRWEVGARWTWGLQGAKDRATNAGFKVAGPGGAKTVRVNMADRVLAGRFNPLTVLDLGKGQKVEVTLSNDADNSVVADAVRLLRLPDGCSGSELLYEGTFSGTEEGRKAEEARDWVMEGGGISKWADGYLRLRAKNYTRQRSRTETDHFVYWLKQDFPADFAVEWDFRVPDLGGLAIIFICAKGVNGEDIFDPKLQKRDGIFSRYYGGDINCYHVSYYAGGRGRANVRKNSGFYLVTADDDLVARGGAGRWHRLRLTHFGGMLELSVNGKRCITWFDDGETFGPVRGAGKIGLRQQNNLRWGDYRNLRVYALKKK